ncbi:hypothetical protein F383_20540 [Gossypium arboreum]|uniref:Uncharacterized protein n=1 Tax=Gossypium arboreum TaxID=29729 RepID=A0A0B0NMY7_GOSAR|nr:hypothetical protein F383_20540 [Gossypium arboreum]
MWPNISHKSTYVYIINLYNLYHKSIANLPYFQIDNQPTHT